MNVCMLAYTFYESDTRVKLYAESLISKGNQVDIIALRRPGENSFRTENGIKIYKIQKRQKNEKNKITFLLKLVSFFLLSSFQISILSLKKKYDVIHVHSVPDFEIFAAWLPKLMGSKLILDIHDLVPELYISKFNTGTDSSLFKSLLFIEKISCSFANHVIIANHLWHKTLTSRSVPEDKCSVVMNYPNPQKFYPREEKKLNKKLKLIYPGTLSKHQGLEVVIRAVAKMKKENDDVEFNIYGQGTDELFLKELVNELSLNDCVFINGPLPLEDISKKMADADIGVEPKIKNIFSTGAFSTKIFEFMMIGVPVVASDTDVHKFYFDESHLEFFKAGDPDDLVLSIRRLSRDSKRYAQIIRNGFELMKKFNWSENEHDYYKILESLVQKNPKKQITSSQIN